MIKILIISNTNLYSKMLLLEYKNKNIELKNISEKDISSLSKHIPKKSNIIFLPSSLHPRRYMQIFDIICNNSSNIIGKNIIVIISNKTTLNTLLNTQKLNNYFIKFKNLNVFFNLINELDDLIDEEIKIKEYIDDIFKLLQFTPYHKGTLYLKKAIFIAYYNQNLLYDTKELVYQIWNHDQNVDLKTIRSDMDKSIYSTFDIVDINIIYDIFGSSYDGRRMSLKYFIYLLVDYLNKKNPDNSLKLIINT